MQIVDMNECGSVVSWLTGMASSIVRNPDETKKYFETGGVYEKETPKEWCKREAVTVRNGNKRVMHRLDPVKIFYEMCRVTKAICIADPKGNTIGIRPGALKKFSKGKFSREQRWAVDEIRRSGSKTFQTYGELIRLVRKIRNFTPRQKRIFVHATSLALQNIPQVNPDTWIGMKPYWKFEWQELKLKPLLESYQSGACFVGVEIEEKNKTVFKAHIQFNHFGPKSFTGHVEKDLPEDWDKLFDCK